MKFTALKDMAIAWIRGVWGKTVPALKAEPIAAFGMPLALAGALLFSWAFGETVQPTAPVPLQADASIGFGQRLNELESAVADLQRTQLQPEAPALPAPRVTVPATRAPARVSGEPIAQAAPPQPPPPGATDPITRQSIKQYRADLRGQE